MTELTQEFLKKILHYNPGTGVFLWKKRGHGISLGKVAGTRSHHGYIQIRVLGKRYMAHRLAWLFVHGRFPENDIDHINHIRDDNSIENLRACTRVENLRNSRKRSDNTSGYKGVHWNKQRNKWRAEIGHMGKMIYLGRFDCPKEAAIAYNNAAIKLYGEFAYLNEIS